MAGGELLGGDVQRVLPGLDEAAPDAVVDVGQLDPAVDDRAAAERVQPPRRRPHFGAHFHRIAGEQAGVPVAVGDDPRLGRDLAVSLDQAADGGGQARREAARGEEGYGGNGHGAPYANSSPPRPDRAAALAPSAGDSPSLRLHFDDARP
jgi:hypothetical protein